MFSLLILGLHNGYIEEPQYFYQYSTKFLQMSDMWVSELEELDNGVCVAFLCLYCFGLWHNQVKFANNPLSKAFNNI